MQRALHVAILRHAALLVPASARTEWLAEWRAELWYVEHDATAFCLGSFRDALWLRFRSFNARRALDMDSPLRCVLFLTGLAALIFFVAGRADGLSLSDPAGEDLAVGLFWMYFESLLVLLTLNPLALGECPKTPHAPSLLIRLRRWVFLAIKIALLPPILVFAAVALGGIVPPAASALLFFGLIFALRWALSDQRRRCPVCLHFLSNPVEIGSPGHTLLHRHGTRLTCARGHGSLSIPRVPTSWSAAQSWQYADPMRSSLSG
jgi:hypothetical protein